MLNYRKTVLHYLTILVAEGHQAKAKLNLLNYKFYNHLAWKKYRKAVYLYNDTIEPNYNQCDDITNIMLLFFPDLLKSEYMDKLIDTSVFITI